MLRPLYYVREGNIGNSQLIEQLADLARERIGVERWWRVEMQISLKTNSGVQRHLLDYLRENTQKGE